MTATKIENAQDVVTFLKAQHEQIKSLLSQVADSSGEQREEAFTQLRRLLAVHETAEEEIVHPRARHELDNGEAVISARLEEENEGKQVLAELEKMDVSSAEFEKTFASFRKDIVEHAEAEEHEEFERLAEELDADQLEKMRRAVELAESTAPTHPHPGAESRAANMAVGPFAAMMDRARDAITGKR